MKVSSRILLSILSALAIVGCTPKTSKPVVQNSPVERSVGATSVYSTAPTTPTTPFPYTSTSETLRDMETSIEIMYRGMVKFEDSQGIQYDSDSLRRDVGIAARVLADTYFGNNDEFVIESEAQALLKHLQGKYGN